VAPQIERFWFFSLIEGFVFCFLFLAADLCGAAGPTNERRPWCGSSRHAPAFGQQFQLGLLHVQGRLGVAALFGLPRQQIGRDARL